MDRNEKTIELIRQYQNGEEDTRNEIIKLNMPLVHFLAKKLKPHDMEYDDAVSTVMIAFAKTIENFEPDRKIKFSTYAYTNVFGSFGYFYKKQNAKKRQGVVVSLDAPLGDSDGKEFTLLDTLAAPEQDHQMKNEALKIAKTVIDLFKDKYKPIITAMLNGDGTQCEIGDKYGVSQTQVSRVMAKFYSAARQEAKRQGY